ncbi:phosphate transporter PHO1 homolog 10 [Actinidia eriantha]|uniref:phosphate transporter PHO1 homolog 10 n=1 Tax=Actinidia eriantha TaxID=165200 RepID=UPI0025879DA4|nr:phosphate transporter PHO1 homolog 10 [Actinidia eriantha]
MKFGKGFKKHMVPEWTDAYMDYNGLKRLLQDIRQFKQSMQPPTPIRASQHRLAMHRAFSGLNLQANNLQNQGDIEDQVIAVNTTQHDGSRKLYKTKFLMQYEEGGEKEVTFFNKLDNELNKVSTFYKNKVEEALNEATTLNKQMGALIALRIKVEKPDFDDCSSLKRLSMDIDGTMPVRINSSSKDITPGTEHVDLTLGVNKDGSCQDACTAPDVITVITTDSSNVCGEEVESRDFKRDPLEILDHVKINNPCESPVSTIKGVLNDCKERDLSFNKEEIRKVEERLKLVFIEFYRKLHLLKHYSFMNLSAFSKIMKKYDKISSRSASRSYMKIVDKSYLGSSDEVTGLLERVEATFIEHFSNSNRREGMKSLRPKIRREKHCITFFSGFFSGCSIALLVAVVLLMVSRKLMDKEEATSYMENIFPLYSLYVYITLHMLLYASNIYFWRRYRINYPFIFGFKQGTELGSQEVFLLSNGLAVLALSTFLAHLHLKMDLRTRDYGTYTELIPLVLLTVVLVITFCPFNILYRSSRLFLIHHLFRCVCAPLYTVTLPDFFLADQLSSQIPAIRSFEFYICYYGLGEFSQRRNKCHSHDIYNVFYFIVAVIPYWIRFLQCLRRLFEEKDVSHGYNSLRYLMTIVAVVIRSAFELRKGTSWMVLAVVSSVVATAMNTYWDVIIDWGLLQRQSRNFCLRDKLSVSHKSVYFTAMVLDILLRFAWLQSVLYFNFGSLHGKTVSSIISCLEILRRGMWNFFRLENEHLNNVGRYRAFKSVPLPFNYYDADIDKDD